MYVAIYQKKYAAIYQTYDHAVVHFWCPCRKDHPVIDLAITLANCVITIGGNMYS